MSAGDELYVRSLFSSDEVRKEVDEYLECMFKHMLRTSLIRKPVSLNLRNMPFEDEGMMLRNFITEHTQEMLNKAVKEQVLQTYLREKLYEFIDESVEKAVKRHLDAFEKAFKRNKTIPKGAYK